MALSKGPAERILVAGTAGDGRTMSGEDRLTLLRIWSEVAGRDRLVAGMGSTSVSEGRDLLEHAALVMAPPWPSLDTSGLLTLVDAFNDRLVLYSHPGHSPLIVGPPLLQRLASRSQFPYAAKLSKVSRNDLSEAVRVGDGIQIWHGSDRQVQASERAGAAAVVSQTLGALPVLKDDDLNAALSAARAELPSGPGHRAAVRALALAHFAE